MHGERKGEGVRERVDREMDRGRGKARKGWGKREGAGRREWEGA